MTDKVTDPSVKDVTALLKGAWISNYLLSTRFGARRRTLTGSVPGISSGDTAGWEEFFAGPLANATPDTVYKKISARDGRMLTPQEVSKLMQCKLSLCFFTAPASPAAIVYPLDVPFLKNVPFVQSVRQDLLSERKDYVPFAVSQATLNNSREDYLETLHGRMQQTVNGYNTLRAQVQAEMTEQLKRQGLQLEYRGATETLGDQPVFRSARFSAINQIAQERQKKSIAAAEIALDGILARYEKEVGTFTARLIDYVEQAFFVLMGMVEVVDYSSVEVCRRFSEAYKSSDMGEYEKTMAEHSKLCRRLAAMIARFNLAPESTSALDARDYAFLSVFFQKELPSSVQPSELGFGSKYAVAPLSVPWDSIKFAKRARGRLFVFCFAKGGGTRHMLPANAFYTERDLSLEESGREATAQARDAMLVDAFRRARNVAMGVDPDNTIATTTKNKVSVQCQTIRAAAIKRLRIADNPEAEKIYTDIRMSESVPGCPEDECLSARIEEAEKSEDKVPTLATSMLAYKKRYTGCDDQGPIAQALCKARVLRAAKSDDFDAAERLTGGSDAEHVQQFADMVCNPGGVFYDDFAKVGPNLTDGGRSDAAALNKLVQAHMGEQQTGCEPALRRCKRSDMATCLLAALVRSDAQGSPFPAHSSAFEPQRTACTVVREDIEQIKPQWDKLFGIAPCAAIAELMKDPGRLKPGVRKVLDMVWKEACGSSPGVAASRNDYGSKESFDAFMKACGTKLAGVFQPSQELLAYLKQRGDVKDNLVDGLPRETVLPPKYTLSMRDLMRAIQIVSRVPGDRTDITSLFKLSMPFLALDTSALDMYFYTNHPFTRNQINDGVWNGRPLAWAVGGAGSIIASENVDPGTAPTQYLKIDLTDGGDVELARTALGTLYVFTLFRVVDDLTLGSPQLTSQSVGSGIAKVTFALCHALYAKPFDTFKEATRFRNGSPSTSYVIEPKFNNRTLRDDRRFSCMQRVSAQDYAVDRAYESVRYMITHLNKSGDGAINQWITHFKMLIAVSPYLTSETLKECSAGSLGALSGSLCDLIKTLMQSTNPSTAATGVLSAVSPSGKHIWTQPTFVSNAPRVQRQLLEESFGITVNSIRTKSWQQVFPRADSDGFETAVLPPLANGKLVENILLYVTRKGGSADVNNAQFWHLWTIALVGVYFPTIVAKSEQEVATFEQLPNELFPLATTHLLYRVLKLGNNHQTSNSKLGSACFARMNRLVGDRRAVVKRAIQRVLYCGAYGIAPSLERQEGFAPAAVMLNSPPEGSSPTHPTLCADVALGCIKSRELWEKWTTFTIDALNHSTDSASSQMQMANEASAAMQRDSIESTPGWGALIGRGIGQAVSYLVGIRQAAAQGEEKTPYARTPVPNVFSMPTCKDQQIKKLLMDAVGRAESLRPVLQDMKISAAFAGCGAGFTACLYLFSGFPVWATVGVTGLKAAYDKWTSEQESVAGRLLGGATAGALGGLGLSTVLGTSALATGGVSLAIGAAVSAYKNSDKISRVWNALLGMPPMPSDVDTQEQVLEGQVPYESFNPWAYLVWGGENTNMKLYIALVRLERTHMLSVNHKFTSGATPANFDNPPIETRTFVELLIMVCYCYGSAVDDIHRIQKLNVKDKLDGIVQASTTPGDSMLARGTEDVDDFWEGLNKKWDEWWPEIYSGNPPKPIAKFPIDDAIKSNYVLDWSTFSPVSFFQEDLKDAIQAMQLSDPGNPNRNGQNFEVAKKHFEDLILNITVYARLVTMVGIVWAEFTELNASNGRAPTMTDEQTLEAAIVLSQIKNVNNQDLRNLDIGIDSERFHEVVCHEFFDPQHVMFKEPNIIPYNLIINTNLEKTPFQDTEKRKSLQEFTTPLIGALYEASAATHESTKI